MSPNNVTLDSTYVTLKELRNPARNLVGGELGK
jgi:hypothetical protein